MAAHLFGMGTVLIALLLTALYGSVLGLVFCALRRVFGTALNARVRMLSWRLFTVLLVFFLISRLHSAYCLRWHIPQLFRILPTELFHKYSDGALAPRLSWRWRLALTLYVFQGADGIAAGSEGWAALRLEYARLDGGGRILWEAEGIQRLIPVLFFLWLGGLLLFWLRRVLSYVRLHRLLRDTPGCEGNALTDAVRKEAAYRGFTEPIAVKLLPGPLPRLGLVSPCAVGFRSLTLVVPRSQWDSLNAAEREAVIAHEIFHFIKRDNLRNLWLLLIESLLWFAPAVRFALRRERQDLEYLRDLQLIREPLSSVAVREYARALVSVASRSGPYRSSLHAGMLSGSGLSLRIGLLSAAEKRSSRLLTILWLLLILLLLAAALMVRAGMHPVWIEVTQLFRLG